MQRHAVPSSPHHVPDAEYHLYVTHVEALRPDDPPLGVPAEADNNVMKVTDDCLFMRSASGRMYGGFMSLTWWATAVSLVMGIALVLLGFYSYPKVIAARTYTGTLLEYFAGSGVFWTLFLMFPVAFSWMFIPWRRQLPIIFNRKTRKITCCFKGRVYVQDWDTLKAYIKDITSIVYGGFPVNDGVLTIDFTTGRDPETGEETSIRQAIYGTCETSQASGGRGIFHAAMIWEYIRLYMREGKEARPPFVSARKGRLADLPLPQYCSGSLREAFAQNAPGHPFEAEPRFWPISIPLYFVFVLPFSMLCMMTEAAYFCLDRILPRRKWPKELLEACDHVCDGSNDHGPSR